MKKIMLYSNHNPLHQCNLRHLIQVFMVIIKVSPFCYGTKSIGTKIILPLFTEAFLLCVSHVEKYHCIVTVSTCIVILEVYRHAF